MLLDIRMPGIHGVDIMRLPGPRPSFPVIAMTGHVDAEAQEEFKYVKKLESVAVAC